jgi:16S rRNA (guanine527-N7)-methyltransferase
MDQLLEFFPDLTPLQIERFEKLQSIYKEWNDKINVISRKDVDNFYERHVIHSLGIAKVIDFKDRTRVLDVGTGGGFPGIPLAILFPNVEFHLVDSIGKKVLVAKEVVSALKLENVTYQHTRAEKVKGKFDFVVSRAVTRMDKFVPWVRDKIATHQRNSWPNGILYLKGGDLDEEMASFPEHHVFALNKYFPSEFFETKKVVYLPL